MTKSSKKYVVAGPHRVHGKKPGETIELDPNERGTNRLLERGQISASSRGQSSGGASTDGDSSPDTEE